jgi:hypothetical protein
MQDRFLYDDDYYYYYYCYSIMFMRMTKVDQTTSKLIKASTTVLYPTVTRKSPKMMLSKQGAGATAPTVHYYINNETNHKKHNKLINRDPLLVTRVIYASRGLFQSSGRQAFLRRRRVRRGHSDHHYVFAWVLGGIH